MKLMNKLSLPFILLLLWAASAAAQTQGPPAPLSFEPLTKLESLDTQIGTVLVKNFTYIGSVSGYSGIAMVTGYEFVDTQTGRKEYGIGIELRETGRTERDGREARTYVDYDEIDALLRALEQIGKIERSTTMENFEAQYRTRGELGVATFLRPNGTLQSEIAIGVFRRAAITVSVGKLVDFRKLIANAKTTIDKIK